MSNTRIKLNNIISHLPAEAVDELYNIVKQLFDLKTSERPACPYCGGKSSKNGHKCGKQEYRCKSCGKTFVSTTNTIMANSRQPYHVWEEVICDTLEGNAIDYTAENLGISHDCVFHMRHKILLALEKLISQDDLLLEGVVEMDETYVLDDYKGKKLPDSISRDPRKHGAKALKRGISNEYVCICTGVQRSGEAMAQTVNRAKPSSSEIDQVFNGHVAPDALAICDGARSYNILTKSVGCEVTGITTGKGQGFYNLSTVNNFHSFIKRFYEGYRGVATKYLNRYNLLFSIAYRITREKRDALIDTLLKVSNVDYHVSCKQVRNYQLLAI